MKATAALESDDERRTRGDLRCKFGEDRLAAQTPSDMMERDHDPRRRVLEMLEAGEVVDGTDHLHAALVFQRGDAPDNYRSAHELALKAAELGLMPARRLAATSFHPWATSQGRFQKYGTQYRAHCNTWQRCD